MLTVVVPEVDSFDEKRQEFMLQPAYILELHHSLFSVSKWEEKFEKPFLSKDEKTAEEVLTYIQVMNTSAEVSLEQLERLSTENLEAISTYMNHKMTATWFKEEKTPSRNQEIITAEIIYYWMVSLNIPFECQHWHLNKLITLVRVINQKNAPAKKMDRQSAMAQRRQLNAERLRNMGTSG